MRCFALVEANQHGIVSTVSLDDYTPRFGLLGRMEKHPFNRQLLTTHVVAVEKQFSYGMRMEMTSIRDLRFQS